MPISEAQQRATNAFKKQKYDALVMYIPKGMRGHIREIAEAYDMSLVGFFLKGMCEYVDRNPLSAEKISPEIVSEVLSRCRQHIESSGEQRRKYPIRRRKREEEPGTLF